MDFDFGILKNFKLVYLGGGGGGGGWVGARRQEFTPSPMKPGLKYLLLNSLKYEELYSACICSRPCTRMVLSQNTDRWGGKGSGGRRCPLGGASRRGGHGGHLRGHIGHHGGHIGHLGGQGGLGSGGLVGAEAKVLKDTLLPSDTALSSGSENQLGKGLGIDKYFAFAVQF